MCLLYAVGSRHCIDCFYAVLSLLFQTESGMVKLSHYDCLLQHDLNPQSGLHTVPKLMHKHIELNNFQKMSVCIAAHVLILQLC